MVTKEKTQPRTRRGEKSQKRTSFLPISRELAEGNPDDLARGSLYAGVARENRRSFLSGRGSVKKHEADPDHLAEMPTPALVSNDA